MKRTKRLIAVAAFLASGWISLVPVPALAAGSDQGDIENLKTPEEVEARIKEKISGSLNLFLSEREFRVFATAKIKNMREKIILEGSTEAVSSGAAQAESAAVKLPGFTNMDAEKASAKKVDRAEKSRFTFRNRTTLTEVSVRLALEQSLDPKTKELAVKTAQEAVSMNLGDVAKLDVVELDLSPKDSPETAWDWFRQYLAARGGSAIDLLYLSLLLLGSLATLFALRHYYKSKKSAKSDLLAARSGDAASQDKDDTRCDEKLDELIAQLNRHPLITRNFLHNLNPEDKQAIFRSLKAPALQNLFRKILRLSNDTKSQTQERSSQDNADTFTRILRDLERYISLNQEALARPFGFVPLLSGQQMARFIASESDRTGTLKIVAPFLGDHHLAQISQMLNVEEKATFLATLRTGDGDLTRASANLSPSESEERSLLENRMRLFFESVRQESVVDAAETQVVESAFLEADEDSVAVIKQLAKRYGKVPTVYEKYLVGFEDFLGLDLGIARKVMQRVSNEVVATALADREIDARLKEMLGDMRSQLLISMKKRGLKVSKQDITNARNEVLRQYRALS